MEKKITKKELMAMRQMAVMESERMKAIKILLDEDRDHEEQLRASLTFLLCCIVNSFDDPAYEGIIWNEYLKCTYDELLESAETRFPHLDEDVKYLCKELKKERQKKEKPAAAPKSARSRKPDGQSGDGETKPKKEKSAKKPKE